MAYMIGYLGPSKGGPDQRQEAEPLREAHPKQADPGSRLLDFMKALRGVGAKRYPELPRVL